MSRFSWLPCIFLFYFQVQSPLLLLILRISVTELLLPFPFKLFSVASQPATHDLTHNLQVVSMAPLPISPPVFGSRTVLAQVLVAEPNSHLTGGHQPPEGADGGSSWGVVAPGCTPSPVLYHPGESSSHSVPVPSSSALPSAWYVPHGFLSWDDLGMWTKSLTTSEFLIPTLMSIDFK